MPGSDDTRQAIVAMLTCGSFPQQARGSGAGSGRPGVNPAFCYLHIGVERETRFELATLCLGSGVDRGLPSGRWRCRAAGRRAQRLLVAEGFDRVGCAAWQHERRGVAEDEAAVPLRSRAIRRACDEEKRSALRVREVEPDRRAVAATPAGGCQRSQYRARFNSLTRRGQRVGPALLGCSSQAPQLTTRPIAV